MLGLSKVQRCIKAESHESSFIFTVKKTKFLKFLTQYPGCYHWSGTPKSGAGQFGKQLAYKLTPEMYTVGLGTFSYD